MQSSTAAVLEPARPVRPPAPAPPVTIPDGSPDVASLALLASIDGTLVSTTQARVEGINGELGDLVEQSRLDQTVKLHDKFGSDFLQRAARMVRVRQTLESRLAILGGSAAVPIDPAPEVYALIGQVRRWRARLELRTEFRLRVDAARAALVQVETDIQGLADLIRSGSELVITRKPMVNDRPDPTDPHQSGMADQSSEALRRFEALLSRRLAIQQRLAKLDPNGDSARAELVREAIVAAGGVDAVTKVVASDIGPAATDGEMERVNREIATANRKLESLDSESRAAAELVTRRADLLTKLPALQERASTQRQQSATQIVEAALSGRLASIEALEVVVRPELRDALVVVRGTHDELTAVVAELMA